MTTLRLSLVWIGLLLGVLNLSAQDGDMRVERLLDQLGYRYEMTSGGNFKCIFNVARDRSQLVTIQSQTNTYRNVESRELWSLAYLGTKRPPYKVCLRLLEDNERKKMGAWEMTFSEESGKYYIAFSLKIPADTDAETLNAALQLVVEAADEMEEELEDELKFLKTEDEY